VARPRTQLFPRPAQPNEFYDSWNNILVTKTLLWKRLLWSLDDYRSPPIRTCHSKNSNHDLTKPKVAKLETWNLILEVILTKKPYCPNRFWNSAPGLRYRVPGPPLRVKKKVKIFFWFFCLFCFVLFFCEIDNIMVKASHKIEKSILVPTISRTANWNNNWQVSQRVDWEGAKQPFLREKAIMMINVVILWEA